MASDRMFCYGNTALAWKSVVEFVRAEPLSTNSGHDKCLS